MAATAGTEDLLLSRLTTLAELRERGVLSDAEFAREKQSLLEGRGAAPAAAAAPVEPTPS